MDREGVGRTCLALKGVTLDHPWDAGHDAYKVGGMMFAMVGSMGGLSFKTSDMSFQMLTESGKARPAPYLARAKWVHLADPGEWPDAELADYLRAAYGEIAKRLTKKVRTELGLEHGAVAPTRLRRGSTAEAEID